MSSINDKNKVFGKIAAAKTLTEGMPKLKKNASFPSINNKSDTILFLTDIIKAIVGTLDLVNTIVDIVTNSLTKIEKDIKKLLKTELKSIVSCGVDPSLPAFIKSTGTGIVIEVKKIDFVDLFKIDANSTVGKLLYTDVTSPATSSTDFNTFLYGVIQNDGITHTWKDKNGVEIFNITFNSLGTGGNPNNTLTIKTHPNYDNKSLNDLNNNFIDTLTLFKTENVINNLIDIIFGSISFSISKTRKQLEQEEKTNSIIEKMVNEDMNTKEGTSTDEGFFTFSNDEMVIIERRSLERQRGVIKIKTSNTQNSSVPIETLTSFTNSVTTATTKQDKDTALKNGLNDMANASSSNFGNNTDRYSVKLNFFQMIITNLIKAIVSIVLSPKVVMIFLINYKIVYGQNGFYVDALDFIKKNNKLFVQIIKRISGMIIKILLAIAIKKITKLVTDWAMKKEAEKGANQKVQLLSLVGVPTEALRIIKGLGK